MRANRAAAMYGRKSIWGLPLLRFYFVAEFSRKSCVKADRQRHFERHRRKKLCARIATGNYDAIIIGRSQFEKIPNSFARQERLIQEQIFEIAQGIQELKGNGAEKFSVKQLGVDMMFVDESDNYKNRAKRCAASRC